MSVIHWRLRCECAWCVTEEEKQAVFHSISCPCQYSSLVDHHEYMHGCTICRVLRVFVCVCICVRTHALALLLCLRINPDTHLCLCVSFHAMRLYVNVAGRTYLHEFYCHSNHLFTPRPTAWLLACSFVPAAGLHSLPQASPTISCSLSCMTHRWTTAGRRTLHHHSLQREAETDWKMGLGFKKTPITMGYPTGWQAQLSAFYAPVSNISYGDVGVE